MDLTPATQRFILHWGEMGTRWGINRTVAQIHALLFVAQEPLPAEEIAATLRVARSNVSNSLRELQGWDVVKTVHVMGDRRDHFVAVRDVWEMALAIMDERKKRELDPTLETLRECVAEARVTGQESEHTQQQLEELLGMVESLDDWYARVRNLPRGVRRLVMMGDQVSRWLAPAGSERIGGSS
ncbi:GbsR/MarR family transcriptional regulator [Mucisphaera calidilacus]|uniref:HTH-type transcriptional regulator n=1 Tax=Mucisphaera calidilacus TaxID=2527982 RepID=A0A518BTQ6_9BACT|nr:MarR family transcriptional regulator [Mucisphaera calidilacus]QDU70360.1 MarR family protein [Mucisphaera calidilacus]